MNQEQVKNLLGYIDTAADEPTKDSLFTQLGRDCFYCRHTDQWVDHFQGDVQKFLDNINIQHQSRFWESLVFSPAKKQLILTGREVDGCACAFADSDTPPISLCKSCCKGMQEELFARLLGKPVNVRITESYLLGNQRCSTIVDIL